MSAVKMRWMNHVKTTVRKDLMVFGSEFILYFMLFVIFPICLGTFYGVMYQNILEQKIVFNELTIYSVSDGSDQMLTGIFSTLESDAFSFVNIESVDSEEIMNQNLGKNGGIGLMVFFDGENRESINIKWINRGSDSLEKGIVQQFMTQAVRETNMNITVQNQLSTISEDEIDNTWPGFPEKLAALNTGMFVEEVKGEPIKALSSMQMFLISIFISFSVFFTTSMVRQREKKLVQRAYASGVSKITLFLSNSLSTFIIASVMCALYFIIVFALILRLNLEIFPLTGVILLQAFMITGIQSLISGFCRTEKTSNMMSIFVLMGFMFLGGGAMPIDSYGDVSALTNFAPNYHVFKLYEAIVLDSPMNSMIWRVGIVLAISFVLALVGLIVFVKKGGDLR